MEISFNFIFIGHYFICYVFIMSFIKSIYHLTTDRRTHQQDYILKTLKYEKIHFKECKHSWKSVKLHFRLFSIWIGSKSLIEWITFAFLTLNICKRNGWVNCVLFSSFYTLLPYSYTILCKTICSSCLLVVVLIKFNETIRDIPSKLKLWMLGSSLFKKE